jgi:hypothetical protein
MSSPTPPADVFEFVFINTYPGMLMLLTLFSVSFVSVIAIISGISYKVDLLAKK